MAGTKEGAAKTAAKNKELYGDDFYATIGRKGGSTITDRPKGFAANRELASRAGRIGGKRSKHGPIGTEYDWALNRFVPKGGDDGNKNIV